MESVLEAVMDWVMKAVASNPLTISLMAGVGVVLFFLIFWPKPLPQKKR